MDIAYTWYRNLLKTNLKMEASQDPRVSFLWTRNVEFTDLEPHRTMDVFILASVLDAMF